MTPEQRFQQDIDCIEFHLSEFYDVMVHFEQDGADEYWYDPENPEDPGDIVINSDHDIFHQLVVLLHEAGHVELRSDREKYQEMFPDSSRDFMEGRVEILKEEVMAWQKAWELGKKYGIVDSEFFDLQAWKDNYRKALMLYSDWVTKGD